MKPLYIFLFLFAAGMVFGRAAMPPELRLVARELWIESELTAEQRQKTDAALQAVAKDEAVMSALQTYGDINRDYRANRLKPQAERDKAIGQKFREARNSAMETVRKALLAADPSLSVLLEPDSGVAGESKNDSAALNRAVFVPVKDKPGLPRVLLVGDSISIGYTPAVRKFLEGKANVHRIPANGGPTTHGLENSRKWLGSGKWDVIHFNFGIHDAKYVSETETRTTLEQYGANLQKLVDLYRSTGAKLVFATTTPIPDDSQQRFDSVSVRNAIALKCMAANDVPVNDLFAVVLPVEKEIQRPKNVHYTVEGYNVLAKAVAASIEQQLSAAKTAAMPLKAPSAIGKQYVYKKINDRDLSLYVVAPPADEVIEGCPAIVFFHGGGWVGGEPKAFNRHCAYLATRGMVGIQVEYRLINKESGTPRVCIEDAKSAMRWIRRYAKHLGIDPNRIASSGGSAGGHLAAFVGMMDGMDDPADDVRVSAKSQAMVLFNPVIDNGPGAFRNDRFGDRYKEFSPYYNVTKTAPPVLVMSGSKDKLIPPDTLSSFQEKMHAVGVRCEVIIYEGEPHGFFNMKGEHEKYHYETLLEMDKFFCSMGWLIGPPTLIIPDDIEK